MCVAPQGYINLGEEDISWSNIGDSGIAYHFCATTVVIDGWNVGLTVSRTKGHGDNGDGDSC